MSEAFGWFVLIAIFTAMVIDMIAESIRKARGRDA